MIAASAGNHAQAVARHACELGIAATVVMPETTPLVKVASARRLGAEVVLHGQSYNEAAERALELVRERGLTLVHRFEDLDVMAGPGTIGFKLVEQFPGSTRSSFPWAEEGFIRGRPHGG